MVEVAQAINDEVNENLDKRLQGFGEGLVTILAKSAADEMEKKLAPLFERISLMEKQVKSMQDVVKNPPNIVVNVPENAIKMAPSQVIIPNGSLSVKMEQSLDAQLESKLETFHKAYSDGLELLVTLMKSLPIPQVTIPKDAIQIKQIASNVVIPKDAIRVDMQAPKLEISEKAFNVQLRQPKRTRTVKKMIEYGQTTGRPEQILETTTSEDVED